MAKKVILTAAITGAVHIPSMSPYLPITPQQIIDEAVAAHEAGAAVVHLHTRNPETGQPTGDPGLMKEVVDGIREKCDVIIGCTTGGAIGMTNEERLAALPVAKPELASCNDPLALFVVMVSKAHLTSHSKMSGFRLVITSS